MMLSTFKDYLMTHLWKTGDDVVLANLDTIIATAYSELDRVFKVVDREAVATLSAESNEVALPADYRSMRSLVSLSVGKMNYLIPAEFADRIACQQTCPNDYTVVNKTVRLTFNPTAEAPESLECWYTAVVPRLDDETEENWLADDYFDVLLYTVLKHTAPFLREDERVAMWSDMQNTAIASALEENEHERKYAGSPLKINFSRRIK